MNKKDSLTTLATNFLEITNDTLAVILTDTEGNLIHSSVASKQKFQEALMDASIDDEKIANISKIVNPILENVKAKLTSSKISTAVFETEVYRLLTISLKEWIFFFVLGQMASIDEALPYVYLTSEKIYRILGEKENVQLTIPKLGNITGKVLEHTEDNPEWRIKFILIGDSGVGKTSLVNQFVEGKFQTDFRPTIGLNVMTHQYSFLDHKIKMNIYDIGSQKLFKRVRRNYYSGSHAGLIVLDLSNRETFDNLRTWKEEMDTFVGELIPFCVVGNKNDLPRQVSFTEGEQIAQELGGSYIETSALEATNVEDAFTLISYQVITDYLEKQKSAQ